MIHPHLREVARAVIKFPRVCPGADKIFSFGVVLRFLPPIWWGQARSEGRIREGPAFFIPGCKQ